MGADERPSLSPFHPIVDHLFSALVTTGLVTTDLTPVLLRLVLIRR